MPQKQTQKQPQDPYAQQAKKLASTVQRLRGWVGSDPSRTAELGDALVAVTAHRLLGHAYADAAAEAQESVVLSGKLLAEHGPIGPYTPVSDAVRYFTAAVHLAALQAGVGLVDAAGRTMQATVEWQDTLPKSLALVEHLEPATAVWALASQSQALLGSRDVEVANAYADAALDRLVEGGLAEASDSYLALDVHRLVADARWAAGRVAEALVHDDLAREQYNRVAADRLANPGRLSPALVARLAEPFFSLYRGLADRLVAAGEADRGLVIRRSLIDTVRGLTKRLGEPAIAQLAQALDDLAADLRIAGRGEEAVLAEDEAREHAGRLSGDLAESVRAELGTSSERADRRPGRAEPLAGWPALDTVRAFAAATAGASAARPAAESEAEMRRQAGERAAAERAEAQRLEQERQARARQDLARREAERADADRVAAERAAAARRAAELAAAEQAEQELLESERRAAEEEAARLETKRRREERLEAHRLEEERLAAKRREAERLAAEQTLAPEEAERLELERLAAELAQLEQAEAEQAERERAELERAEQARREAERLADKRAERSRLERERADADRLAAEQKRERIEQERQRAEAERLAAEEAEVERLERERAEADRLAVEQERERIEQERQEAERLAAEQAEADRLEDERRAAERFERERAELERAERERAERERREAERVAAEQTEQESQEAARLVAEQVPEQVPGQAPEPAPAPATESAEPDELDLAIQEWQAAKAAGERRRARAANERVVEFLRPRAQTDPGTYGPRLLDALEQLSSIRLRTGDIFGARAPSKEAKALAKELGR